MKIIKRPKEGWIRSLRKALGMSGPQLAERLNLSKSQISQMERMETEDRITLKQLHRVADFLDCQLVYALIPNSPIEEQVKKRAHKKAQQIVQKTNTQMELEAQQLSTDKLEQQIIAERERLIREMPRELWED